MAVKVRCPGCGEKFVATAAVGAKVQCDHCGQALRVPATAANERPASTPVAAPGSGTAATTVRFACPACGAKYTTPATLAGKKIKCKGCGGGVRVPGAATAGSGDAIGTPSPAKRPVVTRPAPVASAPRGLTPVEEAPAELDLYGLQDAPMGSAGGAPADDLATAAAGGGPDDLPPPPRAGYGELTEAKKKAIARRAEKADRLRPSFAGAGMSVSLGAVLGIMFFGWRMMRWMRRAGQVAAVAGAVAGGGGAADDIDGPIDVDPRVSAAETDRTIEADLRKATLEAREWLDPAKHPKHGVFELGRDAAIKMVEGFYQRGAVAVYVIDPTELGGAQITAEFAVKLPDDPARRKALFAWEGECLGLDADELTADHGQHYLQILTD